MADVSKIIHCHSVMQYPTHRIAITVPFRLFVRKYREMILSEVTQVDIVTMTLATCYFKDHTIHHAIAHSTTVLLCFSGCCQSNGPKSVHHAECALTSLVSTHPSKNRKGLVTTLYLLVSSIQPVLTKADENKPLSPYGVGT